MPAAVVQDAPMPANYEVPGTNENEQGSSKRQKSRHRASVACCVVPAGDSDCEQCKRTNQDCVIRIDDERRRPISRAYVTTLTDRVSMLETMLKDQGTEPPIITYPAKTTRGESSPTRRMSTHQHAGAGDERNDAEQITTSPESNIDETTEPMQVEAAPVVFGTCDQQGQHEQEATHGTPIDDKDQNMVTRLLSTRGHLSFDQLSGRLRYFGPTVNSHVYSALGADSAASNRESLEQARRAEKIIRTLPLETHDYLMEMFWNFYNSVLHIVSMDAFNADRENGGTQYYSGFLHICILAMGFRFADKTRDDINRIALPDRESTLHREAKYMLDLELERPGGIPSVAALLILGDSEVGVGRDNTGWLLSGMGMRLAYDLGLHLDSSQSGMSQQEIDVRRMTLWACIIYDRYWSLFLGRPTAIKSDDVEIYSLAAQFEKLGTCRPAGVGKTTNTRIYEALLDLMEIASSIVEHPNHRKQGEDVRTPDQSAYLRMAAVDRELHAWAQRLPADLRYTEENRVSAPYSFYLLHQQYYAVQILLHRPFARYDDTSSPESDDPTVSALDRHFSAASRAICTKAAVAVARIFWQHRQRFDGKQIFCIGMQHAGTAATALIAALAYIPDTTDRSNNLQYLEVLHAALRDMAHGYQPAERMAAVLDAVMVELRGGPLSPGKLPPQQPSTIPARRGSAALGASSERPSIKRRQTSKTKKAKTMNPPPVGTVALHRASDASDRQILHPLHRHRPSDASDRLSATSQSLQAPNDFVMITPQSQNADLMQAGSLLPTPGMPNMLSTARNDWAGTDLNDFPSMPSLTGLPNLPDAEMSSFDFMTFPTEDDWTRWHSGTSDAVDLDTFPPRGRSQMLNFASPPMGGIMNG
ncbi:hypothetical protein LTR95_005246 [Oleoguttula sp. CCFEE 5521]